MYLPWKNARKRSYIMCSIHIDKILDKQTKKGLTNKSSPINISANITNYRSKIYRFTQESYFQEAWYNFSEHFSESEISDLDNYTFILFKPDAALGRCIASTFYYMQKLGFDPIFYKLLRLTRHSIRELWRYELNTSSAQRYPVIDRLLQNANSMFVLFKRRTIADTSACTFINNMKGPSLCRKRKAHHIRSVIKAYDGTLNFIHTPDETIDFIRELGVLFDERDRKIIIQCIIANKSISTDVDINEIEKVFYEEVPEANFDILKMISGYTKEALPSNLDINSDEGKRWIADHLQEVLKSNSTLSWWDQTILIAYTMFPNSDKIERILDYEEKRLFD
jgi:Nucleoside diphosphate kinase